MEISIKESDLRKYLKGLLFEDMGGRAVAAGDKTTMDGLGKARTMDKLAGTIYGPDEDAEQDIGTTVPSDLPVDASDMMATQLANDRPPIEDPDFVPANVDELSRSADVLAKLVPSEKVGDFYLKLKMLVDKAAEESSPADDELPAGADAKMPVEQETERDEESGYINQETFHRKLDNTLRRLIKEAVEGEWDPAWGPMPDLEKELPKKPGRGEVQPAAGGAVINDEEAIYQKIADEVGFSSVGGAKAYAQRAVNKLGFMKDKVPPAEKQRMKAGATSRFIKALKLSGVLDANEMEELMLNRDIVRSLPSFRFFWAGHYWGGAYDKLRKGAVKQTKAAIATLGLPIRTTQTVLNQALGLTPDDPRKLMKKLIKDATAEGRNAEETEALGKKVLAAMKDIKAAAELSGEGIAEFAAELFDRQPDKKKIAMVKQAMEEMEAEGLAAEEEKLLNPEGQP